MKIIFVIRSLNVGGAERQLFELARGLSARGHDVCVVLFYDGGYFEPLLAQHGCKVVSIRKRSRWDLLGPIWRFRDLLRRWQPSVIYSFMPSENLFSWVGAKLTGISPIVWGIREANLNATVYDFATRLVYMLQRWLLRSPNYVLTNSEAAIRDLGIETPSRGMAIVNGIDTARWHVDVASGRQWRNDKGLGADVLLIGAVGRIDPVKNLELFIRAAALAVRDGLKAHFIILGSGSNAYVASLRDLAVKLGISDCVDWMGATAELVGVYNALDLLVSSSDSEGFSNVIAEALACGTPVAATDVGDSAMLVGNEGAVVPKGDVVALARAMSNAKRPSLDDRRRRHLRVADNYSVERLISRTESVLNQLVAGRKIDAVTV